MESRFSQLDAKENKQQADDVVSIRSYDESGAGGSRSHDEKVNGA
jgi:hypothetical protein